MAQSRGPCPERLVRTAADADWKYLLLSVMCLLSLIVTTVLEASQISPHDLQRNILHLDSQSARQESPNGMGVSVDPTPLFRVPRWGAALVDEKSGRPATVDFLFPEVSMREKDLWSRIQCTGHKVNRSCLVENIYYFTSEEQFVILLPSRTRLTGRIRSAAYKQEPVSIDVGSDQLVAGPLDGVRGDISGIRLLMSNCSDYFKGSTFTPTVLYFPTAVEAEDWLRNSWSSRPLTIMAGVTAYGYSLYPHNHGHLLYDGLYPLYVSLIRFGYGTTPFNIVLRLDDGPGGQRYLIDELAPIFGGGQYSRLKELRSSVYRFEKLVVGSRRMAHRSFKTDATLPGSYTFENALYLFSARLLRQYKLVTPHLSDRLERAKECRGVIIDNKRFTEGDRVMFERIALNSPKTLNCTISFIRWEQYSFREQLKVFSQSDIYVSSVGTGMTRAHLLRPGGVVINLGEFMTMGDPERLLSVYQDVQFSVGAAYLNVLYYPRKLWNVFGRLREEPVISLLQKAVAKVYGGSLLPRSIEDGYGPSSQPMVDYCRRRPDLCSEVDGQLNTGDNEEYNEWCDWCSWPDYFGLVPMWRRGEGCIYRGKRVKCHLDHDTFDEVANKDHMAFDAVCHRASQSKIDVLANKILLQRAAQLGVPVGELDAGVATEALLSIHPPDCPPQWPSAGSFCDCFDIRR